MKRSAVPLHVWLLRLTPLFLLFAYSLATLCVPLEYYTFRCWEALQTKSFLYKGTPFYPDQELHMTEQGASGHHTRYAVDKEVAWYTDSYGFRNRNTSPSEAAIVLIGESDIAGSSLTQNDTLSEQLESLLHKKVYNFAPATVSDFLAHPAFAERIPPVVILQTSENLFEAKIRSLEEPSSFDRFLALCNGSASAFCISIDRLFKLNAPFYFKARIERAIGQFFAKDGEYLTSAISRTNSSDMIFHTWLLSPDIEQKEIEREADTLLEYQNVLASRGSKFIFAPLPTKSMVYYELLEEQYKTKYPDNIPRLTRELDARKVSWVDLATPLVAAQKSGELVYHLDDPHWTRRGVAISARAIANFLTGEQHSDQ